MKKCPDALTIFLVPPSLEELERRIRGRRTESEDIVKERLDKARKEIQTKDEPGKVGKLSDGTTVVARPGSTTGGATLEIRVSNRKVYKIRY